MSPKIAVVGSFNTDLTAYMARMPNPGETLMGQRFVTGPGGKGSNQAVAAARLGADVTFIGRIGRDTFARIALELWQQEGINTDYVVQDTTHSTGVAPIWVAEDGQNAIVVVPGANMAVSPADIDVASSIIENADMLITQLEIPLETARYALQVAKSHGVRTILNPAPATHLPHAILTLSDYVTPNESELELIIGTSNLSFEQAVRSMLTREDQTCVVTLGNKGAHWVTQSNAGLIPTFTVEAKDTTGAGDAFNGALAVALAEGQTLQEAIVFANATAALCVTRIGTAPSMPMREEVDALIKTIPAKSSPQ